MTHSHLLCRFIDCVASGIAILAASFVHGRALADWPTYRGDATRSGYHAGPLAYEQSELRAAWVHAPAQPPAPAWPPPARASYWQRLSSIAPRIVDDNTFHPVTAGGRVLFGSSADDSVYCLDFETGKLLWRITTGGPIRYAPSLADGRVYFGSDGGDVYCVDLADGRKHWEKRLAPNDRIVPGNGRLISAWPIRTGVVVDRGIAYAAAGLYPSQGVFVYALDAKTGDVIWQSNINHATHGYLLLTDDYLVIPTGRSTPVLVRRADGVAAGQLEGAAGTYALIAGKQLLSGRGNDGSLTASDIPSQQSLVSFRAEQICAGGDNSYLLSRNRLTAVRLSEFVERSRQLKLLEDRREAIEEELSEETALDGSERQEAGQQIEDLTRQIARAEQLRDACQLWEIEVGDVGCIAACNEFVAVGKVGGVQLRNPSDGEIVHTLPVEGKVLGLAIAENGLVATTEAGNVCCFTAGPPASPQRFANQLTPSTEEYKSLEDRALRQVIDDLLIPAFGGTRGYALLIGADTLPLARTLATHTDYKIVVIDDDAARIDAVREELLQAGLYGSRVAALQVAAGKLPFADYLFNLVVSSRGQAGEAETRWSGAETNRVTRPFGGVNWLSAEEPVQRGELPGAGKWVHQYGNTANTSDSGDRYLSRPLRLQWFGGPGPAQMVDRHLRAPAPLVNGGRMFVVGENAILCVDCYNGTEYWKLDAPQSQRYSMPYDCGYMTAHHNQFAVAVRDQLWLVNAVTGDIERKLPVPSGSDEREQHWGYVAVSDSRIYGSRQLATASRTNPSRHQIDVDYSNDQPIVTSRALFAMAPDGRQVLWEYRGTILNPTITVTDDTVYFVASSGEELNRHESGRIRLREFRSHDPELVALDAATGKELWRQPLPQELLPCRNILYLQATSDRLILSGSRVHRDDSWYRVAVLRRDTGETVWTAEHAKGRQGEYAHGEQVHHPVVLGSLLVCEPVLYDLATGKRVSPPGEPELWSIQRPGHSCGTMSGAGNCLLFRADNPTLLDLGEASLGDGRFFNISPTRPGCWINIIPADGLVLIPEASASCVCHYSLQTSMAFQPVPPAEPPNE